jgi:multidrug efflux pump subunit AcrB
LLKSLQAAVVALASTEGDAKELFEGVIVVVVVVELLLLMLFATAVTTCSVPVIKG